MMYSSLILLIILLTLLYAIVVQNNIQKLKAETSSSFAQLEMQLKYRQQLAVELLDSFEKSFVDRKDLADELHSVISLAQALQNKSEHSPENFKHIADYVVIQDKLSRTISEICKICDNGKEFTNDKLSDTVINLLEVQARISATNKTYNQWVQTFNKEVTQSTKICVLFKILQKRPVDKKKLSVINFTY